MKRWIFLIGLALWPAGQAYALESPNSIISLPEVKVEEEEGGQVKESGEVSLNYSPERLSFAGITVNPAVRLVPSATAASPPSFSIRGMDPSQTMVFIEGVPLTEPVFLSDNLSLVPKLAISRVELYAETAPALLLSGGLGGAVNLRLHELAERTKFLAQAGNLGVLRFGGRSRVSSAVSLDLEYEQAKENFAYWDDNSTPFNTGDDQVTERIHNSFKRVSFLPSFRIKGSQGSSLHLFSLNSFQMAEVPGPINQPNPYRLNDWNSLTALRGKMTFAENASGEGLVFFRARGDDLQKESERSLSLNYTGGARALLTYDLKSWTSELALGLNYSRYSSNEQNGRLNRIATQRIEVPASLSTRFSFGREFELKPALLATFTDSAWNSSPRLGFEFHPGNSVRFFGFSGMVFRQPSLSEVVGNQWGVAPNPGLQTETAKKAELGIQWFPFLDSDLASSHLVYSVFGAKANNLIFFSQVGPDLRRAENIGKAAWLGQELSLRIENTWGLFFRPSVQWLWARNESLIAAENGKSLPYRFPVMVSWEAGVERDNWNLGHRASFFSSSFVDKINQEQLGAYEIHDLYLGLNVKELGSFEVTIQNLFDITLASASLAGVEISKFVSGLNGYPTAGRRVGVTWVYDF